MDKFIALIRRFWLFFVIVAGIIIVRISGLDQWLNFETLQTEYEFISAYIDKHLWLSSFIFILIYMSVVAFSLPVATLMTLLGGFLFGVVVGTISVVVGATLGAVILFVAAKTAFADFLAKKAGSWTKKMEEGFKRDAFSYLLFLRLVPVFPFFIVNLVPAFLGVRLSVFAITTFIGIIPGAFVYALTGAGVGSIENLSVSGILTPQVIVAFVCLGLLALVPIIYRKIKGTA